VGAVEVQGRGVLQPRLARGAVPEAQRGRVTAQPASERRPERRSPGDEALPVPADERLAAGRRVWMDNCRFCHTRGTDGAPKITLTEEWDDRVAAGRAALIESVLKGSGDMPIRWSDSYPARLGVMPRNGCDADVRWFDVNPCYVFHPMNAYEEGDEIVLDGYFQENPQPKPLDGVDPRFGQLMAYVDEHSFQPKLHRWRFNLKTGETRESHLDDRILEFGSYSERVAGQKGRYLYSTTTKPGWFLFTGAVKHDLETGESWALEFGENRFGSEAPFAPRINAQDEDDGYLVSFITDMNENRSECVLIDAKDVQAGPVCRIILPHRISSGTHATWADGPSLRAEQARLGQTEAA